MSDKIRKEDYLGVDDIYENKDDYIDEISGDEKTDETTEETKKSSKKSKIVKEIISWVKVFAIAIVVAMLVSKFVIINANVPTGSMENLIQPGDRMIGLRLAYTFSEPERGDIVIFEFPDNESEIYVKRLIGLPGEKVVIRDSKIYINDSEEPLDEDYLPETWISKNGSEEEGGEIVFEVPEGEYLMLGDNRNVSYDARYWNDKFVSRDQIVAEALFVYYPFDNLKWLESAEYKTEIAE